LKCTKAKEAAAAGRFNAYWDKAFADHYAATQNAHLKELNIERVYYKRSPNPGFPFSELITTERSM